MNRPPEPSSPGLRPHPGDSELAPYNDAADPVVTAEQALLGALLLDPGLRTSVGAVVSADDFSRPAHAALYKATLHTAPSDAPVAARVLDTLARAGSEAAGLTAVYAHTVMAACPRPEHADAYARIVAEAAACRRVREHAVRLVQVARTDLERGGVHETLRHLDVLHRELDRTRTSHPPQPPPRRRPAPPRAPAASPPPPEAPVEEQELLRGLAADPAQLATVEPWLHADDFANPVHAALFMCLRNLSHRGTPVDAVTILWEAHTNGSFADLRLDAHAVTELLSHGIGVDAAYQARHIVRHALLRTTTTAAQAISAVASTQRLHPHHLATSALRLLTPAATARRRWHTANNPDLAPPAATAGRPRPRGPTPPRAYRVPAAARPTPRR